MLAPFNGYAPPYLGKTRGTLLPTHQPLWTGCPFTVEPGRVIYIYERLELLRAREAFFEKTYVCQSGTMVPRTWGLPLSITSGMIT